MMRTIAAISLSVFVTSVGAQQVMELRGNNYACDNPSKMNLVDISRDSELIRHEMLQKNYCWKTVPGLRVTVIGQVGRFSHVQHVGNGVALAVPGGKVLEYKNSPMGTVKFDGEVHKKAGATCKECHTDGMFPEKKMGGVKISVPPTSSERSIGSPPLGTGSEACASSETRRISR